MLMMRFCFHSGESGMEFFVIESGLVAVSSADRSVTFAVLGPGSYFGESCLLGLHAVKRMASVYSRGYTYVYVLKNIDFANATAPFPHDAKLIKRDIRRGILQKIYAREEFFI
jgi:CRP-like cAMP-binding protein